MNQPELWTVARVGDVDVARAPVPIMDSLVEPQRARNAEIARRLDAGEPPMTAGEMEEVVARSGPQKSPPHRSANTREAYWAWRRTREGKEVWAAIERMALEAQARGERRISSKALVEAVRGLLHQHTNNSHTRFIAEELIERHPPLVALIERRKCRKP